MDELARKKLVLIVGTESWGSTDGLALRISEFARVQLAVRKSTDSAPSKPYERVWSLDQRSEIEKPDLVFTIRESFVTDAVDLGRQWGIPYHGLADGAVVTNKDRMYEALRAGGVSVPRYKYIKNFAELRDQARVFTSDGIHEAVLKPLNAGGSAAVIKLESGVLVSKPRLRAAWDEYSSKLDSLAGRGQLPRLERRGGILQQYVNGRYPEGNGGGPAEFATEVFCMEDHYETIQIHEKWLMREREPFTEPVYIAPLQKGASLAAELDRIGRQAAAALGLRAGLAHVEMRLHANEIMVIDVGARGGGGNVAGAVNWSLGDKAILKECPDYQARAVAALLSGTRSWKTIEWKNNLDAQMRPVSLVTLASEEPMTGTVTADGLSSIKELPTFRDALEYHKAGTFEIKDAAVDAFAEVVLGGEHGDTSRVKKDVTIAHACFRLIPVAPAVAPASTKASWPVSAFNFLLLVVGFSVFFPWWSHVGSGPALPIAGPIAFLFALALTCWFAEVRTWLLEQKNIAAMVFAVGAGWAGARSIESLLAAQAAAEEARKPVFSFSARPETQYRGKDGHGARLKLVFEAKNEGKATVRVPFSRSCIFASPDAGSPSTDPAPDSCRYLVASTNFMGIAVASSTTAENALQSGTRFTCQRERPSAFFCIRPFSSGTSLDAGERATNEVAVDSNWLAKAGSPLFIQSVAFYSPDADGFECEVSNEGVVEASSRRLRNGVEATDRRHCWQRSENQIVENPFATVAASL